MSSEFYMLADRLLGQSITRKAEQEVQEEASMPIRVTWQAQPRRQSDNALRP